MSKRPLARIVPPPQIWTPRISSRRFPVREAVRYMELAAKTRYPKFTLQIMPTAVVPADAGFTGRGVWLKSWIQRPPVVVGVAVGVLEDVGVHVGVGVDVFQMPVGVSVSVGEKVGVKEGVFVVVGVRVGVMVGVNVAVGAAQVPVKVTVGVGVRIVAAPWRIAKFLPGSQSMVLKYPPA